ncbi:MAG: hypothetical protein IPK50_01205 [Fibrobacterota bacterium]|nr:MAG: hypothetical protein IPK50_01205 [Fibrobacterota bacterium]
MDTASNLIDPSINRSPRMRTPRTLFLASLAALSLGLVGCYEKVQSASPTSSLSQDGAGAVSFRLSAADLAAFGVAVDSVRIEAERVGFPSRFATGSLQQLVELPDLAVGTWNLKVALYDTRDQIQLYGDAVVQVLPGRTVDVVVHLRRASGSVRVRIILDDPTPVDGIDTIEVQWGENVPSWKPLKYWRTAEGVYLVTAMAEPCTMPYVTYGYPSVPFVTADAGAAKPAARSALMIRLPDALVLGSESKPNMDCIDLYQEHTHFIPWSSTGSLTLYVPGDSIVLPDPVVPPAVDTLYREVSLSRDTSLHYLPVLKAYRSDSGIHVLTTRSDVAIPRIASLPGIGGTFRFGAAKEFLLRLTLDQNGNPVERTVTEWVFLRWTGCQMVTLQDAQGLSWVFPAKNCPIDPSPAVDTVAVVPSSAPSNYDQMQKLPVLGAWRDARGVYIATRYDCNAPPQVVETDMFTMNSGVVRFTPVRGATRTKIGCAEAKHILFVPTSYAGAHQVADATKGTFIDLPGIVMPPVDTSAVAYRLNILRTDSVRVDYELTMDGTLRRTTTTPLQVQILPAPILVDEATESGAAKRIATETMVSVPDTMVSWRPLPQVSSSTRQEILLIGSILRDSIQKILDRPDVRALTNGVCSPLMVPLRNVDPEGLAEAMLRAPIESYVWVEVEPSYLAYVRHVAYADGKTIEWNVYNSPCNGRIDAFSPVDQILLGLLAPDGN